MSTRYHRLARETPAYAWWRLPAAGLLAVAIYFGAILVLILVALLVFAVVGGGGHDLDAWMEAAGDLDFQHLDFFALDMISLAIMIPALLVAVFVTGPRPIGYLSSVTGRLRWGWLGRTSVIAFVVFIVTIGGSVAINELTEPAEISSPELSTKAVVAIGLVLLLTPFQAAAEEYVFRGYILQLVGSWTRFAIIPVIVTVPPFVAGHEYELWGLVDVGIFGLTAAVLTIRTGGLEAGIAAHTANNVVLLVLDALGMVSSSGDGDYGPVDLIPTIISSIVFLVWVDWLARRQGIQRTRPPIAPPPPPPAPMWPPPPYAFWWPPVQTAPQWYPAPPPAPVPAQETWPQQPAWPSPPAPVPSAPALHPNTPDYPGELPPGWDAPDR